MRLVVADQGGMRNWEREGRSEEEEEGEEVEFREVVEEEKEGWWGRGPEGTGGRPVLRVPGVGGPGSGGRREETLALALGRATAAGAERAGGE